MKWLSDNECMEFSKRMIKVFMIILLNNGTSIWNGCKNVCRVSSRHG